MFANVFNILIRTMNRPTLRNAVTSAVNCGIPDVNIIIHSDVGYLPEYEQFEQIVSQRSTEPFGYNLYCNALKDAVTSGHFLFLDDDDWIIPDSLPKIIDSLNDANIVQFSRGGWAKPSNDEIRYRTFRNGGIGLPCLILDAKYKDIANIEASEDGDYLWIYNVLNKMDTNQVSYFQTPIVYSHQRGWGK